MHDILKTKIDILFVTHYSLQPHRSLGSLSNYHGKALKVFTPISNFSVESLQEEVDEEISAKKIGTKLLEDVRMLNLKRTEHVSPNIVLCTVIRKFGLALVCSIAGVVPSL